MGRSKGESKSDMSFCSGGNHGFGGRSSGSNRSSKSTDSDISIEVANKVKSIPALFETFMCIFEIYQYAYRLCITERENKSGLCYVEVVCIWYILTFVIGSLCWAVCALSRSFAFFSGLYIVAIAIAVVCIISVIVIEQVTNK